MERLYLQIPPSGAKYWRLKYRFGGKEKLLALGVYPETTLTSYGKIDAKRQGEVIGKIGMANDNESLKEKIMALITS